MTLIIEAFKIVNITVVQISAKNSIVNIIDHTNWL